MKPKKYKITKQFVSGFLQGLMITEETSVKLEANKIHKPCAGSSNYRVIKITCIS